MIPRAKFVSPILGCMRWLKAVLAAILVTVSAPVGLARATIYKFIDLDKFPKQVSLGGRAVAWVEAEVEEWVLEKIEARDAEAL